MKHLMSGNEATARGVYEAGIKVCSAYPGTPSTEILENLPQYGKDVYCEWAPNEGRHRGGLRRVRGRLPFLLHHEDGGPERGRRPLFTAGYMGVNGAYVVVTADDPSCHSSQNEQDNRHYARAAKIAMVEPSDAQECKDFVRLACEISEEFDTPFCTAPPPASVTARAWWSSASAWSTWPPPTPATPASTSAPPPTPT